MVLKDGFVEDCRCSATLNSCVAVICILIAERHMKRLGKTRPDLFSSLGRRLCAQRCLRSTDMCGMQSSLTCYARGDITLKKFTVFWGFKVLPSFYCHIFKEVIVLCFLFVCEPLQLSELEECPAEQPAIFLVCAYEQCYGVA